MSDRYTLALYTDTPSPETESEAIELRDSINISDTDSLHRIGSRQSDVSSYLSKTLIELSKRNDVSDASGLLLKISETISEFINSLKPGLFGRFSESRVNAVYDAYSETKISILRMSAALEGSRRSLVGTIGALEELHLKNYDHFRYLTATAEGCSLKLNELNDITLPLLRRTYASSPTPETNTSISVMESNIHLLELRRHDILTSRTVSLQTASQIFFLRDSCIKMKDRITNVLESVIPMWETQVAIALGLANSAKMHNDMSSSVRRTATINKKSAAQLASLSAKVQSAINVPASDSKS